MNTLPGGPVVPALTPLQRKLRAFLEALDNAHDLGPRERDVFLEIATIRLASENARSWERRAA